MGLFSSKKTIKVASTVYNMAGDEANRPNFLKSTMFSATNNPNSPYLGESIVQAYLGGPGINQRSLFNYAVRTDYPGLPTYSIRKAIVVDPEVVRPYITTPAGLELTIQTTIVVNGDYEFFAKEYMSINLPAEVDTDWVAEYNANDHTITVMRVGGATVTFGAGSYDANARFVVAEYCINLPSEIQDSQIFIYKVGTGNTVLDALDVEVGTAMTAEFFPFIPIRLNNRSITEPDYATIYEASKKLYKRATKNQKLSALVAKVEANVDLDEIDYAYVQWAVTLNTKDNEAKKYLYEFWKGMIPLHGLAPGYMDDFYGTTGAYAAAITSLKAWTVAQSIPSDPLYGTPKPVVPSFSDPQITTIQLKTDDPALQDFDTRVNFTYIDENVFTGLGKVGAKKGEFWLVKETPLTWNTYTTRAASGVLHTGNTLPVMSIYWQYSEAQYRVVRVFGGVFENYIYGGKAVTITSDEALDDLDDSGFLIPLHMPSLKAAGLVSATQLVTASTYIVFNSYQVFKKKWYQSFLGMLFFIIVVVVAAALIAPSAIGSVSGIFGTNAALGTSLGFSGTSAIVAGAVANALAAIVVSAALSAGSTALFGAKWGAIIGSILSFALTFGMAGGFSNLATLFQPSNLLALSSSLANGYQGFVQANIAEMNTDMFKVGEEYQKEMDRIQDLLGELMGNDLAFNPMSLTDVLKGNGSGTGGYLPESLDDFIQRTTLTGSDIVDLTLSMINDFSDLSLALPRT